METTIIYDTHIESGNNANKNYGGSEVLEGKLLFPSHILLRWDISSDILKELKLLLNINETRLGLSGTENTWPTNINMKFDLYSLSKPFDELEVTWNSAPKAELLAKDFVSVLSNRSSGVVTLNLLPYSDFIKNGIMLKLNDFLLSDINNKYPGAEIETHLTSKYYPYVGFHSSESQKPPILIYDYGIKPPQPKITSPTWGAIINKKIRL